MRVEEAMSTATCCRPDDPVRECARLMKEQNIGFLPICNDRDEPVGAITDRDLAIRVLADGRSSDEPVESFMTKNVIGCRIGDDVKEAERLMRDERASRIMVCDTQGKLKGVISFADLTDVESDDAVGETLQQVKSDQPPAH